MKTIKISISKFRFIIYSFLVFIIVSCDQFLDVGDPNSQLTSSAVFQDKKTCDAALMNIYVGIRDTGFLSGNNAGLSVLMGVYTDELNFYSNNLPSHRELYLNTVNPQNQNVLDLWNTAYSNIYKINSFLEGVENSTTLDAKYKAGVTAEALALRGITYYYLYNLFGEVPYITGTDYVQNQKAVKDKISVIISKIETDFNTAHDALVSSGISNPKTRIGLYALEAFMARFYLNNKDWIKARLYAGNVIGSSGAQLETNLANEFNKSSTSSLWQFSPNTATGNALEAISFVINTTPPAFVSLSPVFVSSFESGDNRKSSWIKTITNSTNTWYQPNKYKVLNPAPQTVENSIVLRLSEQYLIRAEACTNLTESLLAEADLNKVRVRAGLPAVSGLSVSDLKAKIKSERRHELFTEFGFRFFDLKRAGELSELLSQKPNWKTYNELLPIPEKEIILNPNLLPQNNGY